MDTTDIAAAAVTSDTVTEKDSFEELPPALKACLGEEFNFRKIDPKKPSPKGSETCLFHLFFLSFLRLKSLQSCSHLESLSFGVCRGRGVM